MPNHVHLIVRPFDQDEEAHSRITHSWKRYASRTINSLFGLSGEFWQNESFDRIIRDEEHLWRTVQYIGRNPKKAELQAEDCYLWISPAWEKFAWNFVE